MKSKKKTKSSATLKNENPEIHSPTELKNIQISFDDSARVQAALNLSEAIKSLASVIEGSGVVVKISGAQTINGCHFIGAGVRFQGQRE